MGRIDNSIDAMMMRMDDLRDIAMGRASYGEIVMNFLGSGWMQNSDCSRAKGYDGGETMLKTDRCGWKYCLYDFRGWRRNYMC